MPEELYDVANDPDCLINLIADAKHQASLPGLRSELEGGMKRTKDPMLEVFIKRHDEIFREAYVQKLEKEALNRRKNRLGNKRRSKATK